MPVASERDCAGMYRGDMSLYRLQVYYIVAMDKLKEEKEKTKGFNYREQHAVIIKVATEREQKEFS